MASAKTICGGIGRNQLSIDAGSDDPQVMADYYSEMSTDEYRRFAYQTCLEHLLDE